MNKLHKVHLMIDKQLCFMSIDQSVAFILRTNGPLSILKMSIVNSSKPME